MRLYANVVIDIILTWLNIRFATHPSTVVVYLIDLLHIERYLEPVTRNCIAFCVIEAVIIKIIEEIHGPHSSKQWVLSRLNDYSYQK